LLEISHTYANFGILKILFPGLDCLITVNGGRFLFLAREHNL
jgi:hypothetical protein